MCSAFRVVIVITALLVSACDNNNTANQLLVLNGLTMGTTYTVKINEPDSHINPLPLKREIETLLDDINSSMSTYLPDSELSMLNRSVSTDWINISAELYDVINAAININHLSGGAFDITIGRLVNLWGFGPEKKPINIPDDARIRVLLESTGTGKIHLHESIKAIKKDRADIYIDLSGIAKGYAVDRVASLLQQAGVENYLVEIGGEIRVGGVNQDRIPWKIGIEKPVDDQRSIERIINLDNTGMATSGDYRNYYDVGGIHYSHIIDPKTGKPVTHQLLSVTVLHQEAMIADAWGTALLVLGPKTGIELAEKLNLPVYFIIKNQTGFDEIMSSNFSNYINLEQ